MNARAALFDVYGDHLRLRGGVAPVSSLIELLAAVAVAAPAVRTAVSRMVRQGWLSAVRTEHGPGYQLTERATRRLDEAATRIYRQRSSDEWDGQWSVLVVEHTSDRTRRERLHRGLEYLGYRPMHPATWIAPRRAVEVEAVIGAESLDAEIFSATYDGDAIALLDRLWALRELAAAYADWQVGAERLVEAAGPDPDERAAFATRSGLVHEWRKFLFRDPGLPRELLPAEWPGDAAATFFDTHAARLLPAASAYVDCCLHRRNHE